MNAQRIVSDVRAAAANFADACEELAAIVDQVDALGGASAQEFTDFFTENGAAIGLSAAQFGNFLNTAVLVRTMIRGSGTAEFGIGHHTNTYTAIP